MTDQPYDGGLAFPFASELMGHAGGMSLRDWFAGHFAAATLGGFASSGEDMAEGDDVVIATSAYIMADAMLAARNGSGK